MIPRHLLMILLLAVSGTTLADVIRIGSSTDWRATDVFEAGYTSLAFDDSAWRGSHRVYGALSTITGEQIIWDHPDPLVTNPSDPSLPNEAWFRHVFTIGGRVTSGVLDYLVNDEIDIFINGVRVVNDRSGGASSETGLDVTSALSTGANVIAVYGFDGGITPRERGAAYFSIGMDVTSVPAPAGIILIALGMLGFGARTLLDPVRSARL